MVLPIRWCAVTVMWLCCGRAVAVLWRSRANPHCMGWAWGLTERDGNHSCNLKSKVTKMNPGNCTSACKV